MLKPKLLEIYSVTKNVTCPILLCFGIYTPSSYALSCKIKKFNMLANRKKSKYYLGTPTLKTKLL